MSSFKTYALYFAWVISLAGLVLSLYFGELLRFEPCRLCWYQRIFLFPLAILLGLASYREDKGFVPYALVLSFLGGLFALYQVLELYIPAVRTPALCGYTTDCSTQTFELWGFLTFPLLSFVGFISIFVLLILAKSSSR